MNRSCQDIQLLLTEFADDELAAAEAEAVASHVARCGDCLTVLNQEMTLRQTLGSLPVQAGPTIPVPAPVSRGRHRRWQPVLGGLVAAALALAVLIPDPAPDAPGPLADGAYTTAQVAQARRDVRTSLILAARILEKTERHTVVDVFGRQLPRAVSGSIRPAPATPEGGQG